MLLDLLASKSSISDPSKFGTNLVLLLFMLFTLPGGENLYLSNKFLLTDYMYFLYEIAAFSLRLLDGTSISGTGSSNGLLDMVEFSSSPLSVWGCVCTSTNLTPFRIS